MGLGQVMNDWKTFGDGRLYHPRDMAVDSSGNLWIADTENHRIQKLDTAGNWTSYGQFGAAVGEFKYPFGIDIDKHGNIWVADRENFRI